MLSLTALAGWESAVLASVRGATGSIEERDAQITRSGLYAEYPAILAGYLDLVLDVDDDAIAAEALKRAVFIAWYSFNAPSTASGISELPESAIRRLMDALGDAIAAGHVDDELRAMLVWYARQFGYVFEHFGPVRGLGTLVGDVSEAALARLVANPPAWAGRGQMGEYWTTVAIQGD